MFSVTVAVIAQLTTSQTSSSHHRLRQLKRQTEQPFTITSRALSLQTRTVITIDTVLSTRNSVLVCRPAIERKKQELKTRSSSSAQEEIIIIIPHGAAVYITKTETRHTQTANDPVHECVEPSSSSPLLRWSGFPVPGWIAGLFVCFCFGWRCSRYFLRRQEGWAQRKVHFFVMVNTGALSTSAVMKKIMWLGFVKIT